MRSFHLSLTGTHTTHPHLRILYQHYPLRLRHEVECPPVATVNLQRIIYLGSALLVELPLSVAFLGSPLGITAVLNDFDTTSVSTIFLTSTHHTKSSSSDRTRASTSVPPSSASSHWITSPSRSGSLCLPSHTTASSVPVSILLAPTAFRPTTGSLSSTSLPFPDREDDHDGKQFPPSTPKDRTHHRARVALLHLTWLPLSRLPYQTTTRSPPLPPPLLYLQPPPKKAHLILPGSSLAHRFCNADLHGDQAQGSVGLYSRASGFYSQRVVSEQEEVAGIRGYGYNRRHAHCHCGDPNRSWKQGRSSSRDLADGSRHGVG